MILDCYRLQKIVRKGASMECLAFLFNVILDVFVALIIERNSETKNMTAVIYMTCDKRMGYRHMEINTSINCRVYNFILSSCWAGQRFATKIRLLPCSIKLNGNRKLMQVHYDSRWNIPYKLVVSL